MKYKGIFVFLCLLLPLFSVSAENSSEMLSVTITAEVAVSDPYYSGAGLARFSESSGGYYTRRSDYQTVVRIPASEEKEIAGFLEKKGTVMAYSVNTVDITTDYLSAVKQLGSRENLLAEYRRLFASADLSSTLTLERELTLLLNEIESLKGRIRKMENDSAFLTLDVSFYTEDYIRPPVTPSSFEWINSVDFHDFIRRGNE